MNFFVPYARDRADAERFLAATRAHLASEYDLATTGRRILALETDRGSVEIGYPTPSGGDNEVVMAILECAEIDIYLVVTHSNGQLDDPPYPLALSAEWRVVDFD